MSEITEQLSSQVVSKHLRSLEINIREAFPGEQPIEGYVDRIHRYIYPNGVEVYTFDGVPFFKTEPVQFETVYEDGKVLMKMTQGFEKL